VEDQREAVAAGALMVVVPPWLRARAAADGRPAAVLLAEAVTVVLERQLEPGPAPT
jgi:hypothetical protein